MLAGSNNKSIFDLKINIFRGLLGAKLKSFFGALPCASPWRMKVT